MLRPDLTSYSDIDQLFFDIEDEGLDREYVLVESPRPQAGFPSPAADYTEDRINLKDLLVKNEAATYFARVANESLRDLGIHAGNVVAVDRSITAVPGLVVVAIYDGDLFIKVLGVAKEGHWQLESRNTDLKIKPMPLTDGHECEIWGVATRVVVDLLKRR